MRIEKLVLAITIAATILAVPVAHGLQARGNQVKIEKSNNQKLEFEIKSKQKLIEEKEQQRLELERKNQELEKQLQSKRDQQAKIAAQPASAPVVAVRAAGNCEAYRPLLAQYNWPVSVAMEVMRRESGCNPNAVSPTNDHGLFQIHAERIYDPAANVARAYQKFAASGWRPWYCCPEYW